MVPLSSAMVSAPPDFSSEKCAGPQMVMLPPSTRSMCACPDFTCTSLPLRSTVRDWPFMNSTLIGPCTEIESPAMVPTVSGEGGLSGCAWARPAVAAAEPSAPLRKMTAVLRHRAIFARDGVKPDDSLELRGDSNPSILYEDAKHAKG